MKRIKKWIKKSCIKKVCVTFVTTILLLAGCAQASTAGMLDFMKESWRVKTPYDTTDKWLYAAAIGGHTLDGISTIGAIHRGGREVAPFAVAVIGNHPKDWQIVAFKAGGILFTTWAANNTSGWARKISLGVQAVVFTGVAVYNFGVQR